MLQNGMNSQSFMNKKHLSLHWHPNITPFSSEYDDVGYPSVCCEYHWLIKNLLWAYCSAEMARRKFQADRGGESKWSQGESMWPPQETDA